MHTLKRGQNGMALSSQEMMSHKIRKQEIIKGRKHDALVVVVVALIFFERKVVSGGKQKVYQINENYKEH